MNGACISVAVVHVDEQSGVVGCGSDVGDVAGGERDWEGSVEQKC